MAAHLNLLFFKHEKIVLIVLREESQESWFEQFAFGVPVELPSGDAQCSFEKYGSRVQEKDLADETYYR